MKMNKKMLLALIGLTVIIGSVGAYVAKFMISLESGVTVGPNTWKIAIFQDAELTIPATTVTFPNVEEGSGAQVVGSTLYVANVAGTQDIYLCYNSSDIPEGMTLSAYYEYDGTPMGNWAPNLKQLPDWSSVTYVSFEMKLTVDASVPEGSSTFGIDFYALENDA